MTVANGITRFLSAQAGIYKAALHEIRCGKKETHWMWFIFPQVKGLGYSDIAKYYEIQSRGEAKAYLAHPVLGRRLEKISEALLDLGTNDPVEIFGAIDAIKLQSSMTLFWAISKKYVFADVLLKYFNGELDYATLEKLRLMEE